MRPLFGALLLAACSPTPSAPPAPTPTRPAEAPPVATLAGEWKVVAIDGKDFNEPYGLALSADSREIWWAPRCAGMIRSYTISGSAIRIRPALGARPRKPGEPTPPVCAIGLPPMLDEVTRAIDSATSIRRTPNNGVEISGGGRSLLLFSQ